MANGDVVGAELLIIKAGRAVFHEAYGWGDRERKEPVERNAVWSIKSMSKPVTATAVLMLAEEGKLSLDDPVSRYIPGFAGDQRTTVRHLLAQRVFWPESPSAHGSLADAFRAAGNLEDASTAYERAIELAEQAEPMHLRTFRARPEEVKRRIEGAEEVAQRPNYGPEGAGICAAAGMNDFCPSADPLDPQRGDAAEVDLIARTDQHTGIHLESRRSDHKGIGHRDDVWVAPTSRAARPLRGHDRRSRLRRQ